MKGLGIRLALALAIALVLVPIAPASAAVTVTAFSVQPSTTQAGGHPDLTITTSFASSPATDDVKDLKLRLAPGLVGNPLNAAQCSRARFTADDCPASSRVGDIDVTTVLLVSLTAHGDVYNLRPGGGEPARLGVVVRPPGLPKIFLEAPAALRRGPGGYALETTIADQPRTAGGLPIRIASTRLTLRGRGGGGPFMRNPTSCGRAVSTTTAISWDDPGRPSTRSSAFTPTGCAGLPFSPRAEGTIGAPGFTRQGALVPARTTLRFDPDGAGLRRADVLLPPSVGPGLSALGKACPAARLAAGRCPRSSHVGAATVRSPLAATPLRGPVVLAESGGPLPKLVLLLSGPVSLQLEGTPSIGATGATTTFDGNPDLPLSSFTLAFNAGRRGILQASRNLCGRRVPRTLTGSLLAHSGRRAAIRERLSIVGCRPLASGSLRVGRRSARLSARVIAGERRITAIRLALPRGVRSSQSGRPLRRQLRVRAGGRRLSARRIRRRGSRLRLRLPRRGVRDVRIAWRGLRAGRGLRRAVGRRTRRRLTVRLRVTDTRRRTYAVRMRVRPRR